MQNMVHLVQDLAGEEAAVLALDVLPEGHLQQREPHVQRLDDVALDGQVVRPAGGLASRHLPLDGLEAVQHLRLQLLEFRVQDLAADAVHGAANLKERKEKPAGSVSSLCGIGGGIADFCCFRKLQYICRMIYCLKPSFISITQGTNTKYS